MGVFGARERKREGLLLNGGRWRRDVTIVILLLLLLTQLFILLL